MMTILRLANKSGFFFEEFEFEKCSIKTPAQSRLFVERILSDTDFMQTMLTHLSVFFIDMHTHLFPMDITQDLSFLNIHNPFTNEGLA